MATELNGRPRLKAGKVSRRSLLSFLRDDFREGVQRVEENTIEVVSVPATLRGDELRPHGAEQVAKLLERLGTNASLSSKNSNDSGASR